MWVARPLPDADRAAVETALAELDERLAPARRDVVIALLARLSVHYPNATQDAQAFGIILSDMADDLMEFSELHVAAACTEWRRSQKWWPKDSELREKLVSMQAMAREHQHRAMVLLGRKEPRRIDMPRNADDGAKGRYDTSRLLESLGRSKRVG